MSDSNTDSKVVLITGAGKRVGATIARHCHRQGMRVAIHYRCSATEAEALAQELNQQRHDTAITLQAELQNTDAYPDLIKKVIAQWGQLDVLINNASSFYPTPLGEITEKSWSDLLGSNLKAPLFLSQAALPYLKPQKGCIINLVDIQAQRPLKKYPVYCVAKAGLVMLTKCLAKELGPSVRVNAVAPGIALWPEDETEFNPALREKIVGRTALKRAGTPDDIADAVTFLIQHGNYITGQIIAVDGGLSLDY
ncbi:pteridine reductase [Rickettsiella endosymbiont of Dermanyssus gallinae]|uniref:pteridine reductase n=1 Tax=Rickettsiella endosymbiont of Dermanyssus gallinae TaxID=2856608 RepID=UPI001C52F79A|nr:pteridine reductase [Rickettsiella endosymbiont of Dermanyssus gallinae]